MLAILLVGGRGFAQQPTVQARAVQPVAVTGDLLDPMKAMDGRQETRATSGKADYVGLSITLDLGGEQNIIGVWQDHGRWPPYYAGAYKVEVGLSANGPWMKTFEGAGNRGDSKALFEAVRGRFIRITATGKGGGADEWSIGELKAMVDPGAKPRVISLPETPDAGTSTVAIGGFKDIALAIDKKVETRATTGMSNYVGSSFTFDLGGEYQLSRVVQLHGGWAEDYPEEYKVEVSRRRDESTFREVWRGPGQSGRSVAQFEPVNTRYIRITALRNRDRTHWWSIAEIRTNRDPDVIEKEDDDDRRLNRDIRSAVAQGLSDISAAIDPQSTKIATTGRADYVGSWVQLDLGGSYTVAKVIQVHEPDRDFPGRYKIEVSEDGKGWSLVWEGEGERARSTASFNAVRARYIRITATADRRQQMWSIKAVRVRG